MRKFNIDNIIQENINHFLKLKEAQTFDTNIDIQNQNGAQEDGNGGTPYDPSFTLGYNPESETYNNQSLYGGYADSTDTSSIGNIGQYDGSNGYLDNATYNQYKSANDNYGKQNSESYGISGDFSIANPQQYRADTMDLYGDVQQAQQQQQPQEQQPQVQQQPQEQQPQEQQQAQQQQAQQPTTTKEKTGKKNQVKPQNDIQLQGQTFQYKMLNPNDSVGKVLKVTPQGCEVQITTNFNLNDLTNLINKGRISVINNQEQGLEEIVKKEINSFLLNELFRDNWAGLKNAWKNRGNNAGFMNNFTKGRNDYYLKKGSQGQYNPQQQGGMQQWGYPQQQTGNQPLYYQGGGYGGNGNGDTNTQQTSKRTTNSRKRAMTTASTTPSATTPTAPSATTPSATASTTPTAPSATTPNNNKSKITVGSTIQIGKNPNNTMTVTQMQGNQVICRQTKTMTKRTLSKYLNLNESRIIQFIVAEEIEKFILNEVLI